MGYSYDAITGLLACDICGNCGGVRKYHCPFKWCQPTAACRDCRTNKPEYFSVKTHRETGCEKHHLKFQEEQAKTTRLLSEGQAVRCSALGVDRKGGYAVHVLFRKHDRSTIGYYMSKQVYDSFPLATPVTPKDFKAFGKLTRAPATFYDECTTKEKRFA